MFGFVQLISWQNNAVNSHNKTTAIDPSIRPSVQPAIDGLIERPHIVPASCRELVRELVGQKDDSWSMWFVTQNPDA